MPLDPGVIRPDEVRGQARSSNWISSIEAAMPPVVSSLRRCWARVIRVDVALGRAAGSRHRALGQRSEGAILVSASSPGDDVHANRKSRIICLGPGLPCCRNHSDRQNRQSQNAHRNLLRIRYNISAHIDLGQFTFLRQPALSEFNARGFHALARECELTEINMADDPKRTGCGRSSFSFRFSL
jgi:hypothetical protein